VPEAISSTDGSRGNQDQIGPRSKTLTDDEVKHSMEKGPEEFVEKQNTTPSKEIEIKAKVVASSQQQPNQTVRFGKPDDPVSPGLGHKRMSRTTMPGTAPAPRCCSPGLTPNQRRMI
jgi:hypothetical protein